MTYNRIFCVYPDPKIKHRVQMGETQDLSNIQSYTFLENKKMDDYDDGVIEVQVIPQDDNWGETATTITGKNVTFFMLYHRPLLNKLIIKFHCL